MKILLLLLAVFFLGAGCTEKTPQSVVDEGLKFCVEQGGIPIISSWSGLLKDCKFK